MKRNLLVLLPIVFFISCNNGGSTESPPTFNESSYEQQVMSIEEQEKSDPVRFLDAGGKYRENVWGTKFVVDGKITNTATVANYKDVIIEYSFYSQTNTLLYTKRLIYYLNVPHGKAVTFESRIEKEKSAAKLMSWGVVGATPL